MDAGGFINNLVKEGSSATLTIGSMVLGSISYGLDFAAVSWVGDYLTNCLRGACAANLHSTELFAIPGACVGATMGYLVAQKLFMKAKRNMERENRLSGLSGIRK